MSTAMPVTPPNLLTVDQAHAQLLSQARPPRPAESIHTLDADGRILAEAVISSIAVPGFDNSAMDGYALSWAAGAPPTHFCITQRIAAGQTGQALAPGEAARIFTGAPIPLGCVAVVMQEDCEVADTQLTLRTPITPGQHIRREGEDIAVGSVVVSAGTRLSPATLSLIASVGLAHVKVWPRLRVAVFFTGDELTMPGEPLAPGGIYNSNRFALTALLKRLSCQVSDFGNIPDTRLATEAALAAAAQDHDVVITSGGVSVGEEDHVKAAVSALGRLALWRIAMKPGKPLAFGQVGAAAFVGLPGNPVSSFVTFMILVRPYLLACMGAAATPPAVLQIPAAFDWPRADKRREFLRAQLQTRDHGVVAEIFPHQGSGVMTSVAWADGLVDIPAGTTVRKGDNVSFLPFNALM